MTQKELDELLSKAALGFEDEEEAQEYHRHDVVMESLRLAYNAAIHNSAELAGENGITDKQSILKLLIP